MTNRLRAERLRLGLSQQQVARMCGDMNHSSVSLWEHGRRRPRPNAAARLVAIFDQSLDDLLAPEDDAPREAAGAAVA